MTKLKTVIETFTELVHSCNPTLWFALGRYHSIYNNMGTSVATMGFLEEFVDLCMDFGAPFTKVATVDNLSDKQFYDDYIRLVQSDHRERYKGYFTISLRQAINEAVQRRNKRREPIPKSNARLLFWLAVYHEYRTQNFQILNGLKELFVQPEDLSTSQDDSLSKIAGVIDQIPANWTSSLQLNLSDQYFQEKIEERFNVVNSEVPKVSFQDLEKLLTNTQMQRIYSLVTNIFHLKHPTEVPRLLKTRYLMQSVMLATSLFTIHFPFVYSNKENNIPGFFVYGGPPPGSTKVEDHSMSPESLSIMTVSEHLNAYLKLVQETLLELFPAGSSFQKLYFGHSKTTLDPKTKSDILEQYPQGVLLEDGKKTGFIVSVPTSNEPEILKSTLDPTNTHLADFSDQFYCVEDVLHLCIHGKSILENTNKKSVRNILWRILGLSGLKNSGTYPRVLIEGYALSGVVASFLDQERVVSFNAFLEKLKALGLFFDYDQAIFEIYEKYGAGSKSSFQHLCTQNTLQFLQRLLDSDFARSASDSHAEVFCHE